MEDEEKKKKAYTSALINLSGGDNTLGDMPSYDETEEEKRKKYADIAGRLFIPGVGWKTLPKG